MSHTTDCPTCNGAGGATDGYFRCPQCQGRGEVTIAGAFDLEETDVCDDDDLDASSEPEPGLCGECGGSGLDDEDLGVCPLCGGTGA